MKTLSTIFTEAKTSTAWPESLPYVSKDTNKKYLEAASRLLSKDAKLVISYLIDNDSVTDEELKALVTSGGSSETEKNVVAALKQLKKYKRLQEIPMFQTAEQTEQVINKQATVDELILDFDSEKGRNDIVTRYQALVMKIANGYKNKTNIPFEDIVSAGNTGLTEAINMYGKAGVKNDGTLKDEMKKMNDTLGDDAVKVDSKWISFGVFAAQRILFAIREDIKKNAHTVKIPASVQKKERQERGANAKSRTISGDAQFAQSEKGGTTHGGQSASATVFDKIVSTNAAGMSGTEANDLLSELYKAVSDKFSERDYNIFIDVFGLNPDSDEKIKAKDIAKKYNVAPSNITAIKLKVLDFIRKDSYLMSLCQELMEYFNESVSTAQYVNNTQRIVECLNTGKKYRIICN